MKLSKEDVEHIALLSRLKLTDEEIAHYQDTLGAVLAYVAKLQELETTGVPELAYGSGGTNVFRADEGEECQEKIRDRAVAAFPRKRGTLLEVQAVFADRTE